MRLKKCVIFGSGYMGAHIDLDVFELFYNLEAYSDNNAERIGKKVNGRPIISKAELLQRCKEGIVDVIVVAILKYSARREVMKELETLLAEQKTTGVEIADYFKVRSEIVADYLENHHNYEDNLWHPAFESDALSWLEDINEEIKWFVENLFMENGAQHKLYIERLKNTRFNMSGLDAVFERNLKENDIVLDIGCGIVTHYGNCTDNNIKIRLIPVDALAFFWNEMNQVTLEQEGLTVNKDSQFGMFEFMASFYEENYADYIIINNALEHGIDPYRGLLECLYVLKPGGIIHMRHHRAEGLFEYWQGLHKWNVDYNAGNDFFLWNKTNSINVSKTLADIVEIELTHDTVNENKWQPEIYIDIKKKKNFLLEDYIDLTAEKKQLAKLSEELMRLYAGKVMEKLRDKYSF